MDFKNYIPPDGGHVGCGRVVRSFEIQVAKATNGQKNSSAEESTYIYIYIVGTADNIRKGID